MNGSSVLNRCCPRCNSNINYIHKSTYDRAIYKNSLCNSCSKIGHSVSEESKQKNSNSHIGKIPWNKNKTYEELLGKKIAKEIKNKICKNRKGKNKGDYKKRYGEKRAIEICNKLSKIAKKDHEINPNSGMKNKQHSDDTRRKQRISAIVRIENANGSCYPNYNPKSIPIIKQKATELGIKDLIHAENGGEYHIKNLGYYVDGYSKSKNIVIEYYETRHHKNNTTHDEKRKQEIIDFLGCEFIELKEWNND